MSLDLVRPGASTGASSADQVATTAAVAALDAKSTDDEKLTGFLPYRYPGGDYITYVRNKNDGTVPTREWLPMDDLEGTALTTEPAGAGKVITFTEDEMGSYDSGDLAFGSGTTSIPAGLLRATVFNDTDATITADGVVVKAGEAYPMDDVSNYKYRAFDVVIPGTATLGTARVIGKVGV